MSTPVGIVIRARGPRPLLERALQSVAAQTHDDWTAVVVGETVSDLAAGSSDERISFLDHPEASPAEAANAGLESLAAAGATYVALHDDDATWQPSFLERAVAHLEGNPDDVAVAARVEVVVETTDGTTIRELSREPLAQDAQAASLVASTWSNYIPVSSLVVRDSARQEVGGFDTELTTLEDWDFLLRLLALGNVGFLSDDPLAAWHHGPDLPDRSEAELDLRDRYVRRDLTRGDQAPGGLGPQLAIAHQLRGLGGKADAAWSELSRVTDKWGHAHKDQLDVVSTEVRLEMGRLRGEMLLMREILSDIEEDVTALADRFEKTLVKNRKATEALVRELMSRIDAADAAESARGSRWTPRRVAGGVRRRVSSRLVRGPRGASDGAPQAPPMLPSGDLPANGASEGRKV